MRLCPTRVVRIICEGAVSGLGAQRRDRRARQDAAGRTHAIGHRRGDGLGFAETSSFSAAFRKITGASPSDYRRSL